MKREDRLNDGDKIWVTEVDGACIEGWWVYDEKNKRFFSKKNETRIISLREMFDTISSFESETCFSSPQFYYMFEQALCEGLFGQIFSTLENERILSENKSLRGEVSFLRKRLYYVFEGSILIILLLLFLMFR